MLWQLLLLITGFSLRDLMARYGLLSDFVLSSIFGGAVNFTQFGNRSQNYVNIEKEKEKKKEKLRYCFNVPLTQWSVFFLGIDSIFYLSWKADFSIS